MPSYDVKESFPIATLIDALAQKKTREAAIRNQEQQTLLKGVTDLSSSLGGIIKQKQDMARALAIGQEFGLDPNKARALSPEQALEVGKASSPIPLTIVDPLTGSVTPSGNIPRRGKIVTVPRSNPQQSQYTDPDGRPLIFNPKTSKYETAETPSGVVPVRPANPTAVGEASNLVTGEAAINRLFDSYAGLSPVQKKVVSTPAGYITNPEIKGLENAALASVGFAQGGKQLTGTELRVVKRAFFPNAFDNDESREIKRTAYLAYANGKLDLYQASKLLGAAGSEATSLLSKYTKQRAGGGGSKTNNDPLGVR